MMDHPPRNKLRPATQFADNSKSHNRLTRRLTVKPATFSFYPPTPGYPAHRQSEHNNSSFQMNHC